MTASASPKRPRRVYLDLTHLGRHVTGIERVSIEQFEKQLFRDADVRGVHSRGLLSMIVMQHFALPLLALLRPGAFFVFPGFPPSPLFVLARHRVILYVHDLFLITRRQDLSLKARLYMAPSFRMAVRHLKYFLVNSEKTRSELLPHTARDAAIGLYRPSVGNPFGLTSQGREARPATPSPLRLVMVGTIEPRKNYPAALAILAALRAGAAPDAELHIVGRPGWGVDSAALAQHPGVTCQGYLSLTDAKAVIERADIYLCTSHDEGLGLPLIEAQFGGLPVVAPDQAVFREVLGPSGLFIDPASPDAAAAAIHSLLEAPDWRQRSASAALANAERWNGQAAADLDRAQGLFERGLEDALNAEKPSVA
jgi:glycosyltransferase involved in cell wall biosynthesis